MNAEATLDKAHRLYLDKSIRDRAGLKPGQKFTITAVPGCITITAPEVPARLVKRGKLKVIDAPKAGFTVEDAVTKARRYER